jgi:hypothetical protein
MGWNCFFDVEATGVGGMADGYLLAERLHSALEIKPIARNLFDVVK